MTIYIDYYNYDYNMTIYKYPSDDLRVPALNVNDDHSCVSACHSRPPID